MCRKKNQNLQQPEEDGKVIATRVSSYFLTLKLNSKHKVQNEQEHRTERVLERKQRGTVTFVLFPTFSPH